MLKSWFIANIFQDFDHAKSFPPPHSFAIQIHEIFKYFQHVRSETRIDKTESQMPTPNVVLDKSFWVVLMQFSWKNCNPDENSTKKYD